MWDEGYSTGPGLRKGRRWGIAGRAEAVLPRRVKA